MSNLTEARQSIQDELEHARQGLAFYQSQVTRLEAVLSALEQVESIDRNGQGLAPATRRRGKGIPAIPLPTKAAVAVGSGERKKSSQRDTTLPSTGKDFWPNLIKEQPQSAREVLAAAIQSFGFAPNKDQHKKLVARMTAALNTMVSAGVIQDAGRGRERRFFKAAGQAGNAAA